MRTILAVAFTLSACGFDRGYSPAAQPIADAAIDSPGHDAAPVGDRGCMGNLPASRTITINTGDPIPPSLINEIQDQFVGDTHAARTYKLFPSQWAIISGATAAISCVKSPNGLAGSPVWKLTGSNVIGDNVYYANIPYVVGQTFIDISIMGYGDGVVDFGFNVFYSVDGTAAQLNIGGGSSTNHPASWSLIHTSGSVTHQLLTDTGSLMLGVVINTAGFFYIENLNVTLSRQP